MADFIAVIRKAVDGLTENAPERRALVYDKARAAIRRQLENMNPPAPPELVRRQMEKLEAAIDEVETEHREALPAEDEGTAARPEPDGAAYADDARAGDADEGDLRPADDPAPPRGDEAPHPAKPLKAGASGVAGGSAASKGASPLVGRDHDAAFGISDKGPSAPERRVPREKRRSISPMAMRGALAAVALLLFAGAGYGLWANRDALSSLVGAGSEQAAVEPAVDTETDQGPAPADAAGPSGEASTADPQANGGSQQKFTQRLRSDGSEVDDGPAPEPTETAQNEGRSIAPQSEAPEAVEGETESEAEPLPGAEAAGEEPADGGGQEAIGVSQKMYLYEERLGQQAPNAIEGTVAWSVTEESPGGDALPEPAIHGEISLPGKNMTALITIKRNADPSLPASHLIEIVFALPGDFDGGGIDTVQRVTFKQTEQDRGDALIAVPAKITGDFFMVALNDYPQAVETNMKLLAERNWIDIPVTYTNGRRALVTLEKGSSGAEVFEEAIKAWAAKSNG